MKKLKILKTEKQLQRQKPPCNKSIKGSQEICIKVDQETYINFMR